MATRLRPNRAMPLSRARKALVPPIVAMRIALALIAPALIAMAQPAIPLARIAVSRAPGESVPRWIAKAKSAPFASERRRERTASELPEKDLSEKEPADELLAAIAPMPTVARPIAPISTPVRASNPAQPPSVPKLSAPKLSEPRPIARCSTVLA